MNAVAPARCHAVDGAPSEAASIRREQPVWLLGPVPPPVTGLTLLTQAIVRALQEAGPVRFANWSPGRMRRTLRTRLRRNVRILQSIFMLLAHGRVADGRVYMVANSQAGLYLTALTAFVSRRLGYTIYLHHHVYSYIDRYDWRMAWIDRCLGGRGIHVVHDKKMADDFCRCYPTQNRFAIVHPSIVGVAIGRPREASERPFRLGLLSSLSMAKGLGVAIDTFQALRDDGRDVALTLAGPVPSSMAKRLIEQAIARHPDRLRYLGPVYGDDKSRFLSEIDAFVFPTMTESWGLVLNEALGAGVPVITFDRGCTSTVVGKEAGLVIPADAPFVEAAVLQIGRWMDHSDAYRHASQAAVAQAEFLHREGQRTLADFVRQVFAEAPPDSA